MKGNKILAGILSAAMVLATMAVPAFAEDENYITVNDDDATTYTTFSAARDAASNKGYTEVTYKIHGKVVADEGVDATSNVWLSLIDGNDTDVKTINFVGADQNAELNISQHRVILALNNEKASADVNFSKLTLSKSECNGDVYDLGHSTKYFTTWLRCPDAANRTVTYTECTFTNGSCNNQYGKTIYKNCTFKNSANYCLWVYTALKDDNTSTGAVEVTGGTMDGLKGVKAYTENATGNAKTDITLDSVKIKSENKPAVVASIAGNITLKDVDTTECTKGIICADFAPNLNQKTLADITVNGKKLEFLYCVDNKDYYTTKQDAETAAGTTKTIKSYVARIGGTYYETFANAVASAKTGETVTLLCDASGNGIQIPSGSDLTLDLNGKTYTIDGALVGSSGTVSQAFQLLKDSNITIQNGTITSKKALMLVQNYSNLTLDNVTLDGTELPAQEPYTLSNNNGNVTIKNSTIIGSARGFAFDVCDFDSYKGATVTVQDSTINGLVEISNPNGGEMNSKLVYGGNNYSTVGKYYITADGVKAVSNNAKITGTTATADTTDNSKATGFLSTIAPAATGETINASGIFWTVTGNGETRRTDIFDLSNIESSGSMTIGLIINGLNDANAKAVANVLAK